MSPSPSRSPAASATAAFEPAIATGGSNARPPRLCSPQIRPDDGLSGGPTSATIRSASPSRSRSAIWTAVAPAPTANAVPAANARPISRAGGTGGGLARSPSPPPHPRLAPASARAKLRHDMTRGSNVPPSRRASTPIHDRCHRAAPLDRRRRRGGPAQTPARVPASTRGAHGLHRLEEHVDVLIGPDESAVNVVVMRVSRNRDVRGTVGRVARLEALAAHEHPRRLVPGPEPVGAGQRPRQPAFVAIGAGAEADQHLAVDVEVLGIAVGQHVVLGEAARREVGPHHLL